MGLALFGERLGLLASSQELEDSLSLGYVEKHQAGAQQDTASNKRVNMWGLSQEGLVGGGGVKWI